MPWHEFCNMLAIDRGEATWPTPLLKEITMLWTIAVILIILWLLGLVTANTMGGFIHVLLVVAIVVVLLRVIQGRRIVS